MTYEATGRKLECGAATIQNARARGSRLYTSALRGSFELALHCEAVRSCPRFVDGVVIVLQHQRHSRTLANVLSALLNLGGYVTGERKQSCGVRRNHNVPRDSASSSFPV